MLNIGGGGGGGGGEGVYEICMYVFYKFMLY